MTDPNTIIVTPEEEELWQEKQQSNDIQIRNRAQMRAWQAAGEFISTNAHKLDRMTLRQAYEQGFLDGYKKED